MQPSLEDVLGPETEYEEADGLSLTNFDDEQSDEHYGSDLDAPLLK